MRQMQRELLSEIGRHMRERNPSGASYRCAPGKGDPLFAKGEEFLFAGGNHYAGRSCAICISCCTVWRGILPDAVHAYVY